MNKTGFQFIFCAYEVTSLVCCQKFGSLNIGIPVEEVYSACY